jgi:hypothetical protein
MRTGIPIQWLHSMMPSNTLATINGLLIDCAEREVLGSGVEIRAHTMDETNTRIRPDRIIRRIRRDGGRGLVMMVGVQTNQFPRAVDLSRKFLEAGNSGCDRRFSCFRLQVDAEGAAAGNRRRARDGHLALCR